MKKALFSSPQLLLNLCNVCVFADPRAAEKDFTAAYDAEVRKTITTFPDLPGIAIVVIKEDQPIFVRAYGMADREAGIKADADTLFYIASSTKAFTALVAAMLDQEGKLKFSDAMTKYSPGIRFKSEIPDKVTIRDLLTHTSGLRNGPLINRLAFTGQIDRLRLAEGLLMMPTLASTTTQTSATTFTGSRYITN
jgi:CubicO group peptidase (beta-lactamase class C family)